MKILHTADWHIGQFKGPVEDGVNLRSLDRKGSAQWNEEDRLQLVTLLVKAGYCVKIGRRPVPGQEDKKNGQMEYTVEYWEE